MIHTMRVLVTGETGRVGRAVVGLLTAAGVPVRALTRRPEAAALPANVEVVTGDLTMPESLDAALRDVGAVSLVWTVPPASAPAVVERLAARARRGAAETAPVDDRDVAAVATRTLYEDGHAEATTSSRARSH
jgi:uncharacterized protein YbjT (DUF2867 family)